jgi:hypothetical protein
MNKIVLPIFIFLLVPALSYAAPAINFNEISYDFGDVRQGDRAEHVFEFGNNGDQELVIEKVTSS